MKKMILLIAIFVLISGLLIAKYITKQNTEEIHVPEEEIECGDFKDNTDYDAPKQIKSTEIVDFYCQFSAIYLTETDSELVGNVYELTAKLEDDEVIGCYGITTTYEYSKNSYDFKADKEFLDELQKIVTKHNLVQYNGLNRYTYGIEDIYGACLSIKYASEESIYANNNQDNFLPVEVMEEIENLFRKQIESLN